MKLFQFESQLYLRQSNIVKKDWMHTKSTQMRGYSYHFSRSLLAHSPSNRLIDSKDAITQVSTNTLPTNHRYHLQHHLNQENQSISKKEIHSNRSRESKDGKKNKNYQYSILPLEFKNQKNHQFLKDFDVNLQNYEGFVGQTRSSGEFRNQNDASEISKKPVNVIEQKLIESQLRKEKDKRLIIERSFDTLKLEHIKLLKKIKKLEGQITQKDHQIQILKQMRNSSQKEQRNTDKIIFGNERGSTCKPLRLQSNLLSYLVENLENSFDKDNSKQLSRSTITCSYQDEYRQILSIFSIEVNEDNFHQHLLKDIKKMIKRNDDYDKMATVFKERQKEIAKITHVMKKIQSENCQLSQMVQYFNEEQSKIALTLLETIKEKQMMHLSLLNKKYAQLQEGI